MSWSQAWERFKDKVSDAMNNLTSKADTMKEIIAHHPALKHTLENNLSANNAKTVAHKEKQNKENGR